MGKRKKKGSDYSVDGFTQANKSMGKHIKKRGKTLRKNFKKAADSWDQLPR